MIQKSIFDKNLTLIVDDFILLHVKIIIDQRFHRSVFVFRA